MAATTMALQEKPTVSLDYDAQLWQARFSPCGKFLAGAGYDRTIQRWDATSDEFTPLAPLTGHNGWVQCLAFQPKGELLFTADSWGQLACWRYADEQPKLVWSHKEAHPGWIRSIAVSPDGRWVASAGYDSIVRVWSTKDGKLHKELDGHTANVFSVCFHPDCKSLVSGDLEGVIRHWELASAKLVRELDASTLYRLDNNQQCGGVRQLNLDAEGKWLVAAGQKASQGGFATGLPCVLLFDWKSGKQSQEMQIGTDTDGFIYDVHFHPDGFIMATAGAFPGKGQVWFWRPGEKEAFYISKKLPNGRSLSLHPDGRLAMLVCLSRNSNGKPLKDGEYLGGSSRIDLLAFGPADAEKKPDKKSKKV